MNVSIRKRFLAVILAAAALMLSFSACVSSRSDGIDSAHATTMEFVKSMGLGINLGNTLESCGDWINGTKVSDYETAWGSPIITEKMIKGYKKMGFGVIRIPVAWSNMMDDEYNISDEYLKRVKQITDWVLDNGMKAIVNIHWDNGWFAGFSTNEEECMKKYEKVWTQLSKEFGSYSHELMFESLNEEGCWEDMWNRYSGSTVGKKEAFDLLGRINQKFVDIVRSSGKNNETRHLLIAGYSTDVQLTCDELFVLPNDPANRYAVSVHYYIPSTFAIIEEDVSWGKAQSEWGTDSDIKELEDNIALLYNTFVAKGIPVIVGEYGCSQGNKTQDMVRKYIKTVCREIYVNGMCPVLWDVNNAFYDREAAAFKNMDIISDYEDIKKLERK